MTIDYKTAETSTFPNFKGGEKALEAAMFFDGKNRILKGTLVPGASIGLHRHETSSEIMYFISGSGKAICEGVEERVKPDMVHYCPKGSQHTLINDGNENLVFVAVVPEQ